MPEEPYTRRQAQPGKVEAERSNAMATKAKRKSEASKFYNQEIARIQRQRETAKKALADMGVARVRLSRARAKFIAEHWDDEDMWEDVALEVGHIRQELESMWKQWKSDHPIKSLFKSQRQKVLAYLKNCNALFGKKEFYEAFAKGEYGDRFANYCYYGSVDGKWPKS